MAEYGVLVHGAGWVSTEHVRAYQRNPHTEVVAICSRTRESAERLKEATGAVNAKIYTDYEQALADPNVHLVSICTPPNLHPRETILAAQAGKHILIEKAVANSREELMEMVRAVRQAGVKTVVSFVLHWNPQFMTIKRLLEQNAIGRIFYAEVDYWHHIGPHYRQYEWNVKKSVGGSSFLSAGCHAVDAMRYFVQDEIDEVMAYSNNTDPNYEYDTNVVAAVRFRGGAIGKLSSILDCRCPYAFNIDLLGERGTLRDNRIWAKDLFPGQTDWITVPTIRPDSGDVTHHPFHGEIDHFVDCVRNNVESHVSLFDAAKTHEVIYAIDESAATGKPVKVRYEASAV